MRVPVSRHRVWQLAVDAILVAAAWWLAWKLRFSGTELARPRYYDRYLDWDLIALVVAIKVPVFLLASFYDRWWRYVSTRDMWSIVRGVALAGMATFVVFVLFEVHRVRVPSTIWFIDALLCLFLVAGARLLARTLIERPRPGNVVARGKEVIVVGAGDAAQLVVKEMLRNPSLGMTPIGLVDDDPRKKNVRLHGVRVLGTIEDLRAVVHEHRPDEVLIAIPSASGAVRQRVVDVAAREHVPVKTVPGLSELMAGEFDLARRLRPVEVEDVLGREAVQVDLPAIAGYLGGACVLVTGAGGSIGSELCRQVGRLGPSQLVLVDHAEPALFEIERELVRDRGLEHVRVVVADIKDGARMRQILEQFKPSVVFHAAAYKHVAMMEHNPLEAVRNNTLGTRALVAAAIDAGVDRFVLVSTDKAANPQTVMGQSKALCEWIVEAVGHRDDIPTRFSAVRFGNVLGSSGSVIPIFRKQIAAGGPVTVTHPEMTRFFMTIPEAVQLVVQAGSMAERGQVYVLDMGEPVRIVDLAEQMIRLSGREPGTDVPIAFVGPAPGEKLHEELWGEGEQVSPSEHEAIMRLSRAPVDPVWLDAQLEALARSVAAGDDAAVRSILAQTVGSPRRLPAPDAAPATAAPTAPASAPSAEPAAAAPVAPAPAVAGPRQTSTARRPLFVVGDVHGHREVLVDLLVDAGLLNTSARWIGGDARLWLLGDLVDRGPDGIGCVDLAMRLEAEAGAGCLLGNHEVLLLAARHFPRAPVAGGRTTFYDVWSRNGGQASDLAALDADRIRWLHRRPPLVRVDNWLLLHADTDLYLGYGETEEEIVSGVQAVLHELDPQRYAALLDTTSDRYALSDIVRVAAILAALGGSHVVHGHTPISMMNDQDPMEVTAPYVYAGGRVMNVDHCLFAGGPGFVTRLDQRA